MSLLFSRYDKELDFVEFRFNNNTMELSENIGKYISVYFDSEGDIVGGVVRNIKSFLFDKVPGLFIDSNKRSIEIEYLVRAYMYLETKDTLFGFSVLYMSLLKMLHNCKLKVITNELKLDRNEASLSCLDVGEHILKITGPISKLKLSTLLYYCQAWSVVWDEKPLFKEGIYCSGAGPYCSKLYETVSDAIIVSNSDLTNDPKEINEDQRETICSVVDYYRRFFDPDYKCDDIEICSTSLQDLACSEDPFKSLRGDWHSSKLGYSDYVDSLRKKEITLESMLEYYENL